jgi:hypothetical protein
VISLRSEHLRHDREVAVMKHPAGVLVLVSAVSRDIGPAPHDCPPEPPKTRAERWSARRTFARGWFRVFARRAVA